ncbi:hypothetical protein HEB94_004083 [Actinopolymorpha pittospori]|uniref:Uncharacterized protein n=1 Tax=Actinopolymorpha pittospori TaxID=648752 RepID=A0A927MUN9_9ACTN|nr:hypothetical protein [Actinopolymorpha pittospori]
MGRFVLVVAVLAVWAAMVWGSEWLYSRHGSRRGR